MAGSTCASTSGYCSGKERKPGKSLESRKRKSKLGSLDSLEQARAVLESAEPGPRLIGEWRVTVGEVKLAPAPLGRPGEARKGPGRPGSGRTLPLLFVPALPWPCPSGLAQPQGRPNLRESPPWGAQMGTPGQVEGLDTFLISWPPFLPRGPESIGPLSPLPPKRTTGQQPMIP